MYLLCPYFEKNQIKKNPYSIVFLNQCGIAVHTLSSGTKITAELIFEYRKPESRYGNYSTTGYIKCRTHV